MIDNFEKTEIETEKQFTELMTSFDTLASEADCSFMIVNNYYRVLYENNKSMSYQFTRKDMDYLQTNANLKDGYFMTSVDGAVNNSKVVIICSVLKDTDKNIIGYLMLNSLITPVNTTITMLKNSTYIITVILSII